MANTVVQLELPSGLTATLSLYADGSDTLANIDGADTLTEATNRKGLYTATVTEALTGIYYAKILVGSNVVASGWIYLADDTNTYTVVNSRQDADWANGGRLNLLIDSILADTNELQTNQGNWETAPADWTTSEKEQIRYRLRIDGDQTAPADTSYPLVNTTRSRATAFTTSGNTVYALIYNSDNEIYNGSTFVAYSAGDYPTYAQIATEIAGTGRYSLTIPESAYTIEFRKQTGSSAATTDSRISGTPV